MRCEGYLPNFRNPHPLGRMLRAVYDSIVSIAVVDAKEYAMKALLASRQEPASLHQELRHEVRLMKLDMDHRIAVLDLTIESLQRELSLAAATHRQCVLALIGAMVFSSFCVLLAFMSV